ncbi:integrase, catalytic region, zinc finger, CCHC-type containing protein, partial [Tanacetum coccineum]
MMMSSPICLLSKASKSKSWLWHRRLNHLSFGTINDLARKDLVQHQEIVKEPIHEDFPIIYDVLHPSHNLVTGDPGSAQSSSGNVNSAEPNQVNYLRRLH